jgi:hypothetical protein
MTDRRRRGGKARSKAPAAEVDEAPVPQRGGLLRRVLAPRQPIASPFPSLTTSLRRGVFVAGGSPIVLAIAFLGLLALWGGFAFLDMALSAEGMVYVMGLPPLHVPIDVSLVQSLLRSSSALALGSVLALGIGRGVILGSVALLVLGDLRGQTEPRASLRWLPRVAVSVFGIYGIEVALFLFLLVFVQAILGPAAALVMLVLGLHYLGFAPVVAAAEGVPAGVALRLGFRTARLPGARHLGFVLFYFIAVVYAGVGANAAAGATAPATPSMLTWGMALLATFGHVVMIAALAVRWEAVREDVLAAHSRRDAERRGARGGRGRRPGPAGKAAGKPERKQSAGKKAARPAAAKSPGTAPKGDGGTKGRSRKGRRR